MSPGPAAAAQGSERHTSPVDVHVLLVDRGRVLLLRRNAQAPYAAGLWTLPSGHVEAGEDVVAAAIRETREETGAVLTRPLLRCELVMQHSGPQSDGVARTGWFFRALGWLGEGGRPHNAEPHKHDDLMWADLDDLDAVPGGIVAYVRAGLDAIAAGTAYALHWQKPGDAVAHAPGAGSALEAIPSVDHHNVPVRREFGVREWPRLGSPWTWHPDEPVPAGLPVHQSWGWLFAPDGRVLLLAGPARMINMPGGTVEPDDPDPHTTLVRECAEEAAATLGATTYFGYYRDSDGLFYDRRPAARIRTAARITALGPAAVDPATGFAWRRLLAPPRLAGALLGGDASLTEALAARDAAHHRLGVPRNEDWTVEEVPKEGLDFT
ncbi:NUDIX hydrolase [Yinghuangia soli]|uniref:NUDIX hydrolase n=1 Tax=Yinghuangia soli TaxID=2908204 RepID=A0AA41U151_9ACTN|nr:NUDIX hydrolase [Yinghuangia soli]MCF2525779.1 NUDIX hydrolase [Yinghuangia soli]